MVVAVAAVVRGRKARKARKASEACCFTDARQTRVSFCAPHSTDRNGPEKAEGTGTTETTKTIAWRDTYPRLLAADLRLLGPVLD